MIEVVYYVAMSLDGLIATADGGVEWLAPFEASNEDYGYSAFYASVDALLLGSRTFEQIMTFGSWPYDSKPCWVLTRRELRSSQPQVAFTSSSPQEVLSEIEASGLRRAWLVGGGMLAASFRKEALITEYVVSVIPVVLGAGIPLFGSPGPTELLELAGSTSFPNGVVQLRYLRRTNV